MMKMGLFVGIMSLSMKMKYFYLEMISAILTLYISVKFISSKVDLEFLSIYFFMDNLSGLLVVLSCFITFVLLSGSYKSVIFNNKLKVMFGGLCMVMLIFLIYSFLSTSVIYFYIFFEASLIPIFLLIMGWGYQPERVQAGVYMLFYTLFASLPLLLMIFMNFDEFKYFWEMKNFVGMGMVEVIVCIMFILAFLVKLPMFLFHLWLPKAHVEAPVAGSMILAGVLLKLGGYGLWRVMKFILTGVSSLTSTLMILGLIGGLLVSFVCFIQIDMKCLVAYSSVVHMGILLSGMASMSLMGFQGALYMMLGHGLVSSGMFYLVGVNYERFHTRSLLVSKGLMIIFPSLTILWFVLSIFNISAPPAISLLGEILLTSSILFYSSLFFWGLMLMNFMGMVFTFYLYAQSQQGKASKIIISSLSVSTQEQAVGIIHVLSVIMLIGAFWVV